jgi:DGQHR domain-containing protein
MKSKAPTPEELRLPCLRLEQSPGRVLYSFAVDGKTVSSFASITRIHRDHEEQVRGYQRPEVISHIAEIRNYLESERPMIPNAVVLAFDSSVRFEPDRRAKPNGTTPGTIVIPMAKQEADEKPGFVVDGQQRLAAVREANVSSFPLFVTAFITDDLSEQTEQFILVNSTKPLPKGLIYELLPTTDAPLPKLLHRRRYPAQILERLNLDHDSPLHRMIKTPTTPDGFVNHNAILKMIEQSLSDGALYRIRRGERRAAVTLPPMVELLKRYWSAVRDTFPQAWGLPPKKSRLMHGAGIVAMGLLMDTISDRYRDTLLPTRDVFRTELIPLEAVCRWTDGIWYFGPGQQRKWSEIQNTSKDIQLLADHLLLMYQNLVSAPLAASARSILPSV